MRDESHDAFGEQRYAAPNSRRTRWSPYRRGRWPFAVLDVLIVALIGCCVLVETGLGRVDAIAFYPSRPTWGLGQDWLLVLYDERWEPHGARREAASRHGMGAPAGAGRRQVDTIMLLHLPSNDTKPTLIDLPPDVYAPVADHGPGSLRAAFAWGGPKLLVRTTESVTHVGIERYLETGFTGLATMVDMVGGVRVCARPMKAPPTRPMPAGATEKAKASDPPAAVPAGAGATGEAWAPGPPVACPRLSGAQALAYLRTAAHAHGDLDHAEHQRRLVTTLLRKMAGPGVALNPLRGARLMVDGAGTVTTDEGTHLYDLIRLALTLRQMGDVVTTPISIVGQGSVPNVGRVVTLNPVEVHELAAMLVTDCPKAGCPDR